jgi:phosphoribosylanthranilate isomerase
MPRRVAVKICGVTDPGDALLSAELGADFLGLNFWPGSPRFIGAERAREIAAAVRAAAPRVGLVGVFVNPDAAFVEEMAAAVGLDLLQFSGDEAVAAVRPFATRAIKALRAHDLAAATSFADCWGLLLDAPRTGGTSAAFIAAPGVEASLLAEDYGGTGRQWDYGTAAPVLGGAAGAARRVFLAGGLRPENVRRVVASLRPFAVDVCSGVESAPGRKEPRLLRQLFEEIRNGQVDPPT